LYRVVDRLFHGSIIRDLAALGLLKGLGGAKRDEGDNAVWGLIDVVLDCIIDRSPGARGSGEVL
jgi:hypothetical protein